MGDLTLNFNRAEFACHGVNCCDRSAPVHLELVHAVQELRTEIKHRIKIISGFRCRRHNAAIRGAPNSLHTLGLAADINCPDGGPDPDELARIAEEIFRFRGRGIGVYPSWIHLDIRTTASVRWPI